VCAILLDITLSIVLRYPVAEMPLLAEITSVRPDLVHFFSVLLLGAYHCHGFRFRPVPLFTSA
jgi:hypothetical protein